MAVAESIEFEVSTLIFLRRQENGSNIICQLKLTTNLELLRDNYTPWRGRRKTSGKF